METLGKYFPNTPMLGAIIKIAKIMDENTFITSMEKSFKHKFASKPQVIEPNMAAVKRALEEVRG